MAKSRADVRKHDQHAGGGIQGMSPTMRDVLSVVFLYAVTLFLFRGIIFSNAAFASEGDTAAALSYAHVGAGIASSEGVDVLWMPYFFSGMPTFGNVAYLPHNVSYVQTWLVSILNYLFLNGKWTWLVVYYFLNGLFMFLLMRLLKFQRPAALLAAITVMLSPYAIGLAGEGHGSKLMALSYLPLVFLLTHLLFERRDLMSFGLLSAAVGTLLLTNHMQIVYYELILLGLYLLYHIVMDFRTGKLLIAKKTLLFAGALLVGLCISSYVYLSVYEYSQYSIRGGGTTGSAGGLSWDYATNWSWSPWELLTLLMPSFFGFQGALYWGAIDPWTNSSVYIGIAPILLAAIALIYRRNRMTVFLAIVTAIVFLISFGRNFPLVYEVLFRLLPFFNKFRAPAMILHLLPFTAGILAAYGFAFLLDARDRPKEFDLAKASRALLYIAGGLLGLLLLGLLLKQSVYDSLSTFMFLKEGEIERYRQQYAQQLQQVIAYLKQTRFDLWWKDFIKFTLIGAATAGVVAAYLKNKLQPGMFGAALIAILLVDLFIVDSSLITPKPSTALEQNFKPDATTAYLQQQKGLFRVFPLPVGGELFMDNTFAYHGIQSVGGYSPAKLKIYQTLLDSCMNRGPDPSFPLNMSVVDMLNVRYLIAAGRLPEDRFTLVNVDQAKRLLTYENPRALPRAFFVDRAMVLQNDHEVFSMLNSASFDPARTALLQQPFGQEIHGADSTHLPVITQYQSRRIIVKTDNPSTGLLVLGEVYYPAGWSATIDGVPTEILRTDSILRSVVVPGGQHEVVFSYDPPLYNAGWLLSRSAWGLAGLCFLAGLFRLPSVRRRLFKRAPDQQEEKQKITAQ